MAQFVIDQSGKVEETNQDTVLAFYSHKFCRSILIPKRTKQQLFSMCKVRFKRKIVFRIFSLGIVKLLNGFIDRNSVIMIDNEYPKHERDIKNLILNHLIIPAESIQFTCIGKKSQAHTLANSVFGKRIEPDIVLDNIDIKELVPRKHLKEYLKQEGSFEA